MWSVEMKWCSDPSGHCFCLIRSSRGSVYKKSIGLMTSHDGDSNLVHLFDFPLFEEVADLMKNNRGSTSMKDSRNTKLCVFCFTGVAEQFALAEAAMNVWSMNDCIEQPSTSLQGLNTSYMSKISLLMYCKLCSSIMSEFI